MSTVKIVKDEQGNVIRQSRNPEIGYIRLVQETVEFQSSGWLKKSTRSCLFFGKIEDFKAAGVEQMTNLPGKLIIKEQLEPFGNDSMRDLKMAGDSGIICRFEDQPIYRKTFYTQNMNETDIFIQHTNGDEIKAYMSGEPELEINENEEIDMDNIVFDL